MKGRTGGLGARNTPWQWGQHLAIAAAYGAVYEIARHLSFPQWMLTSGLRLAALLLLPIRYWPALALGEGLPLLEDSVANAHDMGLPWAISASVPMVVLWMAALKPMRRRWSAYDERGGVRLPLILAAALVTAVITAIATLLTALAAILQTPTGAWPDPATGPMGYFLAYSLGAYLGALTLTPTILALHERFRSLRGQPLTVAGIVRSPLFKDVVAWLLPTLAALLWVSLETHDDFVRQAARLALLLPVLAMAVRHGWHGTAIGGMAASVALAVDAAVTSPGLLAEASTIRVEAVLALVISGSLLVGYRVPAARAAASAQRL
ncbi:MASE1 domain-containing protein [Luteibacter aegosomatissinici]|uniref:MASE1 domain-containing protein n=1 Tax=Luteibacter aegosomatissinici TaxID=2911539 RepID=UPI001FF85E98|nr:MASE1 domain-containing protein [Luteibacter aegosomatissinici]UPG92623.1 MASE1 domain-containing protein [Luteibacter aegosomatissinici]